MWSSLTRDATENFYFWCKQFRIQSILCRLCLLHTHSISSLSIHFLFQCFISARTHKLFTQFFIPQITHLREDNCLIVCLFHILEWNEVAGCFVFPSSFFSMFWSWIGVFLWLRNEDVIARRRRWVGKKQLNSTGAAQRRHNRKTFADPKNSSTENSIRVRAVYMFLSFFFAHSII